MNRTDAYFWSYRVYIYIRKENQGSSFPAAALPVHPYSRRYLIGNYFMPGFRLSWEQNKTITSKHLQIKISNLLQNNRLP